MNEYNFIKEFGGQWMDMHPIMKLKLVGDHIDLLTPADAIMHVQCFGNEWSNSNSMEFKYTKRLRPNSRWPWPFRLASITRVIVEGAELYASSGDLRFRIPMTSVTLWPRDALRFDPGQIKIIL